MDTKIASVFEVLNSTFKTYKPNEIFLSFNGGKDCTILLDFLSEFFKTNKHLNIEDLRIIYICSKNPFEEIEDFIKICEKTYSIQIDKRQGNLKETLIEICQEHPEIKAVLMGNRRTDPFCENLRIMTKTDAGWPQLMRINPILDWSCSNVWEYILAKNIPYCILYNEGYTSLGDRTNTKKNPHLQTVDELTGVISYLPAYNLKDDALERAGR